jgi:ABC-2 type transport system ATP-binding protein
MSLAIESDRLTRRFGARLAVDGVSLQVPERSVYGFLGHNGAGKTTTLRLLLGLLRADAGSARICGIDVGRDRLAAACRVGALLESHGLYAHLSGRENLDLCRRLRSLPGSEVERVLEALDLREHAADPISSYSQGMRQRLGLARALLGAPPVLILDEPSNGLDPEGIADMRRLLRELPERSGATVLLSSHLLGEIEQTATHIGILNAGRLVRQGRLDELLTGLGRELRIGTDSPERALQVAREHGYQARPVADGLLARITAGGSEQQAAAALNRVLCVAGIRVHALTPLARSLESLYREAGVNPPAGSACPVA